MYQMDVHFKLYYLLRANVVTTKTNFVYVPETTLDALVASWQLIVGIVTGAVVFIIILVVACKCNLFNRVRVYKGEEEQKLTGGEGGGGDGGDAAGGNTYVKTASMEVDGEEIELRR